MTQRSFKSMLRKVETDLDKIKVEFLRDVAQDLVMSSPVDTGNYVSNHSITTSGGGGRKNSHGKPRGNTTAREEALTRLEGQIASLDPESSSAVISNRSPYANKVEYLGWPGKSAYFVFEGVRARAPQHLQAAINRVKAR